MMPRIASILFFLLPVLSEIKAQCGSGINTFPYNEGFEISGGGWISGGSGNDWAWGSPSKPVISAAGGGTKCWIVGGLTGNSYTNAETAWLHSPCFE